MMLPVIEVEQLSKSFGSVKAVNEVSFAVNEQEKIVLLGTSGCGKTTLLKMINRLIEPISGNIKLNGENVLNKKPEELRRGMGYVLQNHGLFPHYTVAENIAIIPRLLKWDEKKTKNRTNQLLEKLHLDAAYLNAYPHQLSGGQQQRVGLARALVADPPVLLMDEPFGALDNVTRSKILAEFKELDELKRKTIIMVTHDIQEAFSLGDRICLMDKGNIVQLGIPGDLLLKPANKFVTEFLKEQYLLLELKTFKPPSPPQGGTFELNGHIFSPETSAWLLLEQLKFANADHISILDSAGNKIGKLGFEELVSVLHNKAHHHG